VFNEPEAEAAPDVATKPENFHFYQIGYYRHLFDVDSKDVIMRILKTFFPLGQNFFDFINPTPDLYGPFWIATTVVFLMAATSNFADWVGKAINDQNLDTWQYDFNKIVSGAGTIYGYLVILPLIVWGVCKYLEVKLSLVENLCIYGYSFFVYIPASFIMIIPGGKNTAFYFEIIRWVVMGVAAVFSTLFLVRNYFKPFSGVMRKGMFVLIAIAVINIGLAIAFKMFFFAPSDSSSTPPTNSSNNTAGAHFSQFNLQRI